ncbi:hypothetical protein H2198_008611 [Neophaeococcomyces mojaviensis]|uniref:Uncharacterized protein n=1 Tax=Neophaeococcomyces mojaviensis TaxID=3383035 RepID=A0ACC2ZWU9_9EURO|nr:hypothetical protein H2198_008611 [Knufia sp. JES_112]
MYSTNPRQRVLKPIVLTAENFAGNTDLINDLSSRQGFISPDVQARLDTLQRLVHVEGPLGRIPDTLLRDIFDHFIHGGIDDFSMTMWQNLQFSVKKWDGKPATFLDQRTNQELQVSRFGYDTYRQNAGKQITIVAIPRSTDTQDVDYYITFGGAGNKNRQPFTPHRTKAWVDGVCWQNMTWGIWKPIHHRTQDWDPREHSNVVRTIKANESTPQKATPSNANVVAEHGSTSKNQNEERIESATESESDGEWAALESIRARAKERATRKRVRRSSTAENDDEEANDIPHTAPQPPKQKLRIVFHDSRAEGLVSQDQGASDIQPPETTELPIATPRPEAEVIDLEQTMLGPGVPIKAEAPTDADTIEVRVLMIQQQRSSTVPTAVENNTPTITPKRAPTEDARGIAENVLEVEIQFKDSDDQVQETVQWSDCSTASELFDYACACEIVDRNTRMLEVQVANERPVRLMRDKEDQFRSKVVRPMMNLLRVGVGTGAGTGSGTRERMTVVVKKYY